MTPRAGRPSHLKPVGLLGVSSQLLAYQAEYTAGLTPRTPFLSRPAEVVTEDEDEDCIDVKVHRSPGAPITPAPPRRKPKPRSSPPTPSCVESHPRWKLVTWSAVLALVIIVLLSLYNVDPRHVLLPQARSDTLTEWIDVVSRDANPGLTEDIWHPTRTVQPLHPTETLGGGAR
jgi:hypothetical protein